ncbi:MULTISPECIES: PP2C family protein-serine/threonine phosphatase [Mycolicibacterium]|uniref:Serine/threonine-protein phosphatase n=2 Tax=Mycolicibacterium TaxID=1866885 RepID=A0A9X2YKA5_9MYCO|nr:MULTISPECIES: PP2C family serine/threonine-protein phosphatase [Mycolicibacterium]MCV7168679.1 serine/threonine-protein phosphatase [[Mycobacterium] manitobense]MDO3637276.1 serine/threonine-protein phosphatase [Mycolicibacterium arseniciresistens]
MATVSTAATATDKGPVRPTNQDSALVEDPLYAVADGFGTYGDIASRLAVEALSTVFATAPDRAGLFRAVGDANTRIWDHAATLTGNETMGTTLVALAVLSDADGGPVAMTIGDSRLYRIRDGALDRLTEDDSVVAHLVRAGELTEDEARWHPKRHLLTRALGISPTVDPRVVDVDCRAGDRLLISSDGLFGQVHDDEILAAAEPADPDVAARGLVALANDAGGSDNVTVVVIDLA